MLAGRLGPRPPFLYRDGGAGDGAGMAEMMLSPELVELRDVLAKIRAGRRSPTYSDLFLHP